MYNLHKLLHLGDTSFQYFTGVTQHYRMLTAGSSQISYDSCLR